MGAVKASPADVEEARLLVERGWCAHCHRVFDEHLVTALPHNYDENLTQPIAEALARRSTPPTKNAVGLAPLDAATLTDHEGRA